MIWTLNLSWKISASCMHSIDIIHFHQKTNLFFLFANLFVFTSFIINNQAVSFSTFGNGFYGRGQLNCNSFKHMFLHCEWKNIFSVQFFRVKDGAISSSSKFKVFGPICLCSAPHNQSVISSFIIGIVNYFTWSQHCIYLWFCSTSKM